MTRWLALLALIAATAAGLWPLSQAREFQLFGPLVTRVETAEPLVALTFDGGPDPDSTQAILGILAGRGVRATFFVSGLEAESNPAATAALVAAGHEIGNLGFRPGRLVLVRPSSVEQDLARTDAAIRAAGFDGPIRFRPPQGARLFVLPWVLARQGRLTVMWDLAPDDDPNAGPERIARAALQAARPGSILRLHAMAADRAASRAALPAIIDGLRARGLRLVTLSDLLAAGGVAPAPLRP